MNDKIEDTKQCKNCFEIKPIEKFSAKSSICYQCRYIKEASGQIFRRYKLTQKQYNSMLVDQQFKCAICKSRMIKPCVDHDHACCSGPKSCGKCIRKLICNKCNRGLGFFDDSIEHLEEAVNYLKSFRKEETAC